MTKIQIVVEGETPTGVIQSLESLLAAMRQAHRGDGPAPLSIVPGGDAAPAPQAPAEAAPAPSGFGKPKRGRPPKASPADPAPLNPDATGNNEDGDTPPPAPTEGKKQIDLGLGLEPTLPAAPSLPYMPSRDELREAGQAYIDKHGAEKVIQLLKNEAQVESFRALPESLWPRVYLALVGPEFLAAKQAAA